MPLTACRKLTRFSDELQGTASSALFPLPAIPDGAGANSEAFAVLCNSIHSQWTYGVRGVRASLPGLPHQVSGCCLCKRGPHSELEVVMQYVQPNAAQTHSLVSIAQAPVIPNPYTNKSCLPLPLGL